MKEKIDVHVHVGSDCPLMKEGIDCIGMSTEPKNLLKEMDKYNIKKSVILALDIPKNHVSNDYVAELQSKHPDRFIGCACINPMKHEDRGLEEMKRCIDMGLKALKLMPPYQFFHINDKEMYPLYKLLEEKNILLIVHTGTTDWKEAKLEYCRPLEIDTVAVDFPNLNIIMAHSGDPWFEETRDILQKNKNVFADISGIILETDPIRTGENLHRFFDGYLHRFPIDQLLFGTDWPFTSFKSYEDALESYEINDKALKIIGLDKEEIMKRICIKNAKKLFS